MGFFDFLKSKKELEREMRMEQRKQEHAVERVIDKLDDKVKDHERERDKVWEQAKLKLQSGQKAEAARLLTTYKSKMVMINRIERQKQFAQHKLDMITGAKDMNDLTEALGNMARISDISPEQIEENLAEVDMKTADINDMNKIMEKAMEKDMESLNRDMENEKGMDIDDDLMKALEKEVAGDLLGDKIIDDPDFVPQKQELDAGIDEIRKLLNKN